MNNIRKRLNAAMLAIFDAGREHECRRNWMQRARDACTPGVVLICAKAARQANYAYIRHMQDAKRLTANYGWPTATRDLAARFGTRN